MRAQLVHLSGSHRGRTETYAETNVLIGTDPDATVRFEANDGVQPRHAEIAFDEPGCAFHLKAIDGDVFVDTEQVKEVILKHNDLLELGAGGPKVRFKVCVQKGSVCKPVRLMIHDARDVGRVSGPFAFTSSFVRDLFTHATPQLKVGFPILLIAAVFAAGFLGGWIGGGVSARGEMEEEVDRVVAAARESSEEYRRLVDGKLEAMRDEIRTRDAVIAELTAEDEAWRRVHGELSRGVCLIYGRWGLRAPKHVAEATGQDWVTSSGGDRAEFEYSGSGFFVGESQIVTNRHVAKPWEFEERAARLLQMGFQPEFLRFAAAFPGHDLIPLDAAKTRVRTGDELDVAVVFGPVPEAVPQIGLDLEDPEARRGEPVLVVGYPTGVTAQLAKLERIDAEAVTKGALRLETVVERLASRREIAPLVTRGSLGEVRSTRLVYDALTTSGGSGGPVFGKGGTVIGVNFAIVPDFSGSNFGVPVRYAAELIE